MSPIITSSQLHEILRRCNTSELRSLEIVYQADSLELEALSLIASSFSHLHTLKLFRYPTSANDPVDAVSTPASCVTRLARNCTSTFSAIRTLSDIRSPRDFRRSALLSQSSHRGTICRRALLERSQRNCERLRGCTGASSRDNLSPRALLLVFEQVLYLARLAGLEDDECLNACERFITLRSEWNLPRWPVPFENMLPTICDDP